MAFGFVTDTLNFTGGFVKDTIQGFEENIAHKPLTALFSPAERLIEDVVVPFGREVEEIGKELFEGAEGLREVAKGNFGDTETVSLVEDAKLPSADPRGQGGSRGSQGSTSGSLIVTQSKEQPTLLG